MIIIAHMSTKEKRATPRSELSAVAQEWLEHSSLSDATRRAYKIELERFLAWSGTKGLVAERLDVAAMERFARCVSSSAPADLQVVGVSRPLLASSLDQTRRILSAWIRWGVANRKFRPELAGPVTWPKIERRSTPARSLSSSRIAFLQTHRAENNISVGDARSRFVLSLAFWIGMTPTEIAAIRRQDLRLHGNQLEIRTGFDERAWVSAPSAVISAWNTYDAMKGDAEFAVTNLRHNAPVSAVTVRRIIRQASPARGKKIAPLNARQLRNAFVEHAIKRGWSVSDLQRHLRRKSVPGAQIPPDTPLRWRAKIAMLDDGL